MVKVNKLFSIITFRHFTKLYFIGLLYIYLFFEPRPILINSNYEFWVFDQNLIFHFINTFKLYSLFKFLYFSFITLLIIGIFYINRVLIFIIFLHFFLIYGYKASYNYPDLYNSSVASTLFMLIFVNFNSQKKIQSSSNLIILRLIEFNLLLVYFFSAINKLINMIFGFTSSSHIYNSILLGQLWSGNENTYIHKLFLETAVDFKLLEIIGFLTILLELGSIIAFLRPRILITYYSILLLFHLIVFLFMGFWVPQLIILILILILFRFETKNFNCC